ncbi:MAG TPA: Rieske 2Fe-2S domain-containing protein [Alphaproteobacteria bacterium]|nr:Rieske 2Fe-2S domain-containing protein [Alphaproteobacteria bacterium]
MSEGPGARPLCRLDEIPDGGARGFDLGAGLDALYIFVVRQGKRIYGYVNSCPHIGTPLDIVPDRFLTEDRRHIICATHAARFRIYDGYCFTGPCQGESLAPIALELRDGAVLLKDGDALEAPAPPAPR